VSRADALIRELTEQVGLEAVDAHRSAFTALACSQGWTKARVGRWLGISRARVGQKVDKLLHYAMTREDVPTLTEVMRLAARAKPAKTAYDDLVAYDVADWADQTFARQLMARVES
jgi:hypothetical protein